MNKFKKQQRTLMIIQLVIMFGALMGAFYFGFKQNNVNNRLTKIEEYNLKQNKLQENSKIIQDKRNLRKITLSIIDYFSWNSAEERQEVEKRTYQDKLNISKKISISLNNGLDNLLLKSDKEALLDWLLALNIASGITFNKKGDYYKMTQENNIKIIGPFLNDADVNQLKKLNKKWIFQKMYEQDFMEQIDKELKEINEIIFRVHSKLDLSFHKLRDELREDLKKPENAEKIK